MLDASLIVLSIVIALLLRAEPLRRLRPMTGPLLITAAAATSHLLAGTLDADPTLL